MFGGNKEHKNGALNVVDVAILSWFEKLRNHMEDPLITGLVDSCTSLSKLAMIFNISP